MIGSQLSESRKTRPEIKIKVALSPKKDEAQVTEKLPPKVNRLTQEELLKVAQPLAGPNFDPKRDIEDWSDDSSDEESDLDDVFSNTSAASFSQANLLPPFS